jgi:hypothetical protein
MEPESTNTSETANPGPASTENGTPQKRGGPFSGGLGIVVSVVFLAAAAFLTYKTFVLGWPSEGKPVPQVCVCSETLKTFKYALDRGESWPVISPYTNKKTGYPAEPCYWTKDGKRKEVPNYVILNSYLNKPGDTICPECGRLVIEHNPHPPPSTPKAEESPPTSQPTTQPS